MCRELNMTKSTLSKGHFLQVLMTDELYGLALADIHVPDHLKENFEELPPIFKNTIVNRSDLDGYMIEFNVANGMMSTGWRCVLASYFGDEVLLTTDYNKWCPIQRLLCFQFICLHDTIARNHSGISLTLLAITAD